MASQRFTITIQGLDRLRESMGRLEQAFAEFGRRAALWHYPSTRESPTGYAVGGVVPAAEETGREVVLPIAGDLLPALVAPNQLRELDAVVNLAAGDILYRDGSAWRVMGHYSSRTGVRQLDGLYFEAAIPQHEVEARERARQLLRRLLTAEQREDFDKTGRFTHRGLRGRYHFTAGRVGLDTGKDFRVLCIQARNGHLLPVEDRMIAQLLHLRNDETKFNQVANILAVFNDAGQAASHPSMIGQLWRDGPDY
jgi:hypothetical protein